MENKTPDNFPSVMNDFLADLSTTFPEYKYLWENLTDMDALYKYCLSVYPERFFDILYQNDEIFLPTSEINTLFLPNVEFKMLFSVADITDKTKQALWKYLQLILVTIMGSIPSSASFGDAASLFEGINEEELQSKLSETIAGLSDFFKGMSKDENLDEAFEKTFEEAFEKMDIPMSDDMPDRAMPNVDELHEHIKGLFDGKIGALAKELAEELSGDVMNMFDDGKGEIKSTGDILKKMMNNPKKIMELVKKISSKLDDKMKSGNISQEEIMKEAGDLMSKMKGMGNGKDFQNMMQNMMKNMGPMMGMGKGAKMDMGKFNSMMGQNARKERMRTKLQQRKDFILEKSQNAQNANELVFKIPEEEPQEKSFAKPPTHDDWLNEEPAKTPAKKSNKKKGKKGK
jgi:hypothetical protein